MAFWFKSLIKVSWKKMNNKNSSTTIAKKRGKYLTTYSEQVLCKVVEEVKLGKISVYQASKIYQIPKNTLTDRVKGNL